MGRPLLVTHQDVIDPRFVEQGVMHQQGSGARVAEDGVDPFELEAFQQNLSSGLHGIDSFRLGMIQKNFNASAAKSGEVERTYLKNNLHLCGRHYLSASLA
jgi:hypothetical protein